MKCKHCDGTGTTNWCVNGTFVNCPYCGGTGEMEMDMTNEEWFCQLPTEEKAEKFVILCKNAFEAENYRTKRWTDYQDIDYWKAWLKQPHTSKE